MALSLRGHVRPVTSSMVDFIENDYLISLLDYWTEFALKAYWKELVKETKEVNFTGFTIEKIDETSFTS